MLMPQTMGKSLNLALAVTHTSPVYLPTFPSDVLAILFAQMLAQARCRPESLQWNTAGGRKGGSLAFHHPHHNYESDLTTAGGGMTGTVNL
jgi:hypothetical protein